MEENFTFDVYSYKRLDGRMGYMVLPENVGRSVSRSLRKRLELKMVASYQGFSTNKKLPILRAIMRHQGSKKDLRSKIERIIANWKTN